MNYIKQLEQDKTNLITQLEAIKNELDSFRLHLNSNKFTGTEPDGSRKDWIATADVVNRIREMQSMIVL